MKKPEPKVLCVLDEVPGLPPDLFVTLEAFVKRLDPLTLDMTRHEVPLDRDPDDVTPDHVI